MIKICAILLRSKQIKLNINSTHVFIQPAQRFLFNRTRTSLASPGAPVDENEEKVTPMGWFLMLIPVTTFGLGCWQVKRKVWKEQLIKDLETCTKKPPQELPENLANVKDMEYCAVKVKGTFLHEKELLLGPRSFIRPDGVRTMGGLISQRDGGNGYWVVTPFKLAGRDEIVLINRGWISRKYVQPESRQAGQIAGEVEMTCIVRKGEEKPRFAPESKDGLFLYKDLDKMCALTGAQPIFLDAPYESTVPDGPIGGQTQITLHNDHLSYTITWYGLSLATAFLWYRTVLKRKPAF